MRGAGLPRRVAVVAAAALAANACGWVAGRGAALPPLPSLAGQTPAVAAHVRAAHEQAARTPGSAGAVGALCRAYQADLFFDAAAQCYERLATLDDDWRRRYARALIDVELGGAEGLADRLRAIAAAAPGFAPVWLRLGDVEFKAARYDEAAEAWRRAAACRRGTDCGVRVARPGSRGAGDRRSRWRSRDPGAGRGRHSCISAPGSGCWPTATAPSAARPTPNGRSTRRGGARGSRRLPIRSWTSSRASHATPRCCCAWRRRRR